MCKLTEKYIQIAKEHYDNSKGKEREICLMNLSNYLYEKGYSQDEIDNIIKTKIKVEA